MLRRSAMQVNSWFLLAKRCWTLTWPKPSALQEGASTPWFGPSHAALARLTHEAAVPQVVLHLADDRENVVRLFQQLDGQNLGIHGHGPAAGEFAQGGIKGPAAPDGHPG